MYEISNEFPETIIFHGKKYRLNLAFNRVISFFTLFNNDKDLNSEEKLEIACEWFAVNSKKLSQQLKTELAAEIINKFINRGKKNDGNEQKVMDYVQDSAYIYASFTSEYGIDLFKEQDKLHWWKFYSLFEGLSPDSLIKRIMAIRAKKIPVSNGKNSEEIKLLMEQKTFYALRYSDDEKTASMQGGLNKLFNTLEKQV